MSDIPDVLLVFKDRPSELAELAPAGAGEKLEEFAIELKKLLNWFKDFKVDSIELWVSGGLEAGTIPKLFISAKGEAGCKIVLKPS